jgi:hypothetical protein
VNALPKIDGATRVVHAPGQVHRHVDGEAVVLNILSSRYYSLNRVGSRIWSFLVEPRSVAEIISMLTESFVVERAQAEADLLQLLEELRAHGLVDLDDASK